MKVGLRASLALMTLAVVLLALLQAAPSIFAASAPMAISVFPPHEQPRCGVGSKGVGTKGSVILCDIIPRHQPSLIRPVVGGGGKGNPSLAASLTVMGSVYDSVYGNVYYRDKVVVLTFHAIGPYPHFLTIGPKDFNADLAALQSGGFKAITPLALAAFLNGTGTVPPNAVFITFDDGYSSFYNYAFPALRQYGDPALIFLIAGWMGHKPGFLTWDQVTTMTESGLITVGSHTYDDHAVALTGTGQYDLAPSTMAYIFNQKTGLWETALQHQKRVLADLLLSGSVLQANTGTRTPYFAFPYGAYDPVLVATVKAAGFRYLFTTVPGANVSGGNPAAILRVTVGKADLTVDDMLHAIIKAGQGGSSTAPPYYCWYPCRVHGVLTQRLGKG